MNSLNRRQALAAGLALASTALTETPSHANRKNPNFGPLCLFAKPLQWLSFDELASFLEVQDFDGIEATVRKGGQVAPEKVKSDLPKLVDALDAKGKKVVLFASDINSVSQKDTETTLAAAAELGIRYYRMSYYRYDISQPILPQLDGFARELESLVKLNRELGMTALYQNHAGTKYCGAGLWDLLKIAADQPKEQLAVAFDIRHATVEAGTTWPIHWQLLRPHVGAMYFKDFQWTGNKVNNVPMGEGLVDKSFYKSYAKDPIEGAPISIHMEYVDHKKPELVDQSKQCIAADRIAARNLLGI